PAPALSVPTSAGTFEDIAFTATASDGTTGGSTIADIEYRLDGGAWASMEPLDDAFDEVEDTGIVTISFASEGIHQACARGVDSAGNIGEAACRDIQVGAGDSQAPDVTLGIDPNPADIGEDVTISVTADDTATGGSNILVTEYRIDGENWASIIPPDDDAYDSPIETGTETVRFDGAGSHEICGRAADVANNVSEPVCERLVVGDFLPLTVTITRVALIGTGLDGAGTADLYARVSLVGDADSAMSNRDDAALTSIGEPQTTYWNFPFSRPPTDEPISVGISVFDRDGSGDDDLADINPASGARGVIIDVDPNSGSWTGAPLAQECFTGDLLEYAVQACVAVSVRSATADEDGDGIHDAFELYGYDHDGDGSVDVDFPALGANVCRPDLPVEIDWMVTEEGGSHRPLDASLEAARQAFESAPVVPAPDCRDEEDNPPAPGINLILDVDEEIDNEVLSDPRGISCPDIETLRNEHLPDARKPFFVWSGWVHDIFTEGGGVSGTSCSGSPYFVVSLGN
ncbi:MAG: hypothetical protein R3324_10695, partial [Halobacteriales archaeon]|nr:hypothetical protein [Halobacteriales archaeon]